MDPGELVDQIAGHHMNYPGGSPTALGPEHADGEMADDLSGPCQVCLLCHLLTDVG